jgi:UDP-glucose 4-epimerase
VSADPFEYDVQRRVPDVSKAKRVLGVEPTTSLEQILDEVIPWVRRQVELGNI